MRKLSRLQKLVLNLIWFITIQTLVCSGIITFLAYMAFQAFLGAKGIVLMPDGPHTLFLAQPGGSAAFSLTVGCIFTALAIMFVPIIVWNVGDAIKQFKEAKMDPRLSISIN
jgi:hypothetical protein